MTKLVPSVIYTAEGEDSAKRTQLELVAPDPENPEQAMAEAIASAEKRKRTSVTGTGTTASAAEQEARQTADQIVPAKSNWHIVSKHTTGSGTSFTCTMTIEYDDR